MVSGEPDLFMPFFQEKLRGQGPAVVIVAAGEIAGMLRVIAVQQHEGDITLFQIPVIVRALCRIEGVEEEPLHVQVQHFPDGPRLLAGIRIHPLHDQGIAEGGSHGLGSPDELDIGAVVMVFRIQDQGDQAAGSPGVHRRGDEGALVLQALDVSLLRQLRQGPADRDGAHLVDFGVLRLGGQLFVHGQRAVLDLLLYGLFYDGVFRWFWFHFVPVPFWREPWAGCLRPFSSSFLHGAERSGEDGIVYK